jgi:outer membrane protein
LTKNIAVIAALISGLTGFLHAQTAAPAAAPAVAPSGAPPAAPRKLATIHVQNAIMSTKEGQKAAQELQTKFTPRKQGLDQKQAELQRMQSQLRSGGATLSPAAKEKLSRDIDTGAKSLQRENEDFQAEVQDAEGKIMNDLGQKMMEILQKYAIDNSVYMVIDVSNAQSPVLWADASIDITNEIVKRYDQAHPVAAPAPAPRPAPAPPPAPATKK